MADVLTLAGISFTGYSPPARYPDSALKAPIKK